VLSSLAYVDSERYDTCFCIRHRYVNQIWTYPMEHSKHDTASRCAPQQVTRLAQQDELEIGLPQSISIHLRGES
jgi:hypothetical protein